MLNRRLDLLIDYPFQRLAALLDGPPGAEPLSMALGEPQHPLPPMVAGIIADSAASFGKYPPLNGTPEFRAAAAAWASRRFALPDGLLDPERHLLPLGGSREGLFLLAQVVCPSGRTGKRRPVVLLPNPLYQVYAAAALMAGAEPVFVPATASDGFLPDFQALPKAVLQSTALAYLGNPANPQGAVASAERLAEYIALARRHGFVLAVDECYSEIYDRGPPPGALAVAAAIDGGFENVVVLHSLSKRSSVPGLRSGFLAGDARVIAGFAKLRAYAGAAIPLPLLAASIALWNDEAHVEANRALYRAKFDIAEALLGGHPGFHRPPGGFFLWHRVGDGEAAALRLWREAGIRVLPGAYLARDQADGGNPGSAYIRVALVHDLETTRRGLSRLASVLTPAEAG